MISRCNSITRAAVFILFMLALWGAPAGLRAQSDVPCICDHYTFRVGTNVGCEIEICWTFSEEGVVYCQKVKPGNVLRIPCPVWGAYITTCSGAYTIIGNGAPGSICTPGLSVPSGCCVRGCWTLDREGCQLIDIQPAPDCPDVVC